MTKAEKLLSIVIPGLNEENGLEQTLQSIPRNELRAMGYDVEVIVVDGGSQDRTREVALQCGAKVILEPQPGYGIPLRSGFGVATGRYIVALDADYSYPIEDAHELLRVVEDENLDFLTTDRFALLDAQAMSSRNRLGNMVLSFLLRLLFGLPIRDSQSGMWIFRREILSKLRLTSNIAFSQEMKVKACSLPGCRWKEVPIRYRTRLGETKFGSWKVGVINLAAMLVQWLDSRWRRRNEPRVDSHRVA